MPRLTPIAWAAWSSVMSEVIAEHDGLTLAARKPPEHGEDLAVGLAQHRSGLSRLALSGVFAGEAVTAVLDPVDRAASVDHAGADVAESLFLVLERGPAAVQAQEGVLHHVLRRWLVSDHEHRKLDQAERLRPVERRDLLSCLRGLACLHNWAHESTDAPGARRLLSAADWGPR